MIRVSNKVITLQRMFKILRKYDFKIELSNSNEYKCVICKRILCDACQGECGCRYCNECVTEQLNDDTQFCPGNSEQCKDILLSKSLIQMDHRTNNELLRMVIKCPNKMCSLETELMNMYDHMRVCSLKFDKCPFHRLGCGHDKIKCCEIDEYLKDEIYSHSRILIDVISNLKNDTSELWKMKIKYESDFKEIHDELLENREQIQKLRQAIVELKRENDALSEKWNYLKEGAQSETRSYFSSLDASRISDMSFTDDKKVLEGMLKTFYEQPLQERPNIEPEIDIIQSTTTPNRKIIANISWEIERISERRKKNNWAKSNFFYANGDQHKLNLTFWANGNGNSTGNCVTIFFRAISSKNDPSLKWPFRAKIRIRLSNNYASESKIELEEFCRIKMPNPNSFACSDPFDFSYSELYTFGLLTHDCLKIECFVYDEC